ncbi:MAG: tRNA (adenosine(37)-N6)-threonylcarbamoyltransferase complex dimerization subunit type 1 TsaB [Thermodesulfobacteriota bacterium]
MKILAIETSTYAGSIAVVGDDTILGEYYFNIGPVHTEKLIPSIDWLLSELGMAKSDLSGVAVSLGPGSFTSLRVGISTAKGICYSLGIPLIGVSSLKALAMNLPFAPYNICPVIDARKGEVFASLFRSHNGELERILEDIVVSPEGLVEIIKDNTIFVGDGALLYKDYLEDNLGSGIMFSPINTNSPRASNLALSEIGKFKEDRDNKYIYDEIMNLAPHYLRKSEAEISKEGR